MSISVERGRTRSKAVRKHRWVSLLVVALLMPSAPGVASAQESGSGNEPPATVTRAADVGFNACNLYAGHSAYRDYWTCAGEVPSFDGLELEGRIVFPMNVGDEPLPFVVMFHGWGGNREYTFGNPRDNSFQSAASRWEPARFLSRGYAVLGYTARGFHASCGNSDQVSDVLADGGPGPHEKDPAGCVDGHTHLAERDYEVADTKHLLGLLVDKGVADPQRLVATGGSYGGGQAWLLATSLPWETPDKQGNFIQLAGIVAIEAWTDLFDALAPNGRATDGTDQSRSTEIPFGVPKPSLFQNLYRSGRASLPLIGNPFPTYTLMGGRYNTTNPDELHSYIDGWMAVFTRGEPYDSPQALALPEAFRGKSAFYDQEGYLSAVSSHEVKPVPIFTVQGWTDALFPAVQSLQMYRKLKAAHPGYPISMVLADIGHSSQKPAHQTAFWMESATAFVDAVMTESESERVVASFPTSCPVADESPVIAGNWDALQGEIVSFGSSQPASTDSHSSDLGEEAAADPFVSHYLYRADNEPSGSPQTGKLDAHHPACVSRDQAASASGATWRFPLDESGKELGLGDSLTILGLPRVSIDYTLEGEDASVIAKLWDVGTDGTKTLVTRGVYRLSTAAGDPQSGTINFQLFGNHWTFPAGHKLELEIGQRDAPFLRPNNLQSSLDISRVGLEVPTANE